MTIVHHGPDLFDLVDSIALLLHPHSGRRGSSAKGEFATVLPLGSEPALATIVQRREPWLCR